MRIIVLLLLFTPYISTSQVLHTIQFQSDQCDLLINDCGDPTNQFTGQGQTDFTLTNYISITDSQLAISDVEGNCPPSSSTGDNSSYWESCPITLDPSNECLTISLTYQLTDLSDNPENADLECSGQGEDRLSIQIDLGDGNGFVNAPGLNPNLICDNDFEGIFSASSTGFQNTGTIAIRIYFGTQSIREAIIVSNVTVQNTPINIQDLTVCTNETLPLTYTGTPHTTDPFVSADPSIATVDNSGNVTGVSAGTTTVTFTNNLGCMKTATITVNQCCPNFNNNEPGPAQITDSQCQTGCSVTNGTITAPALSCPTGSTLHYSIDNTNWSTTAPSYDNTNALTIYTKCICDSDNTVQSTTYDITTTPMTCQTPTVSLSIQNPPTDYCTGDTYTIVATASGGSPGYSYTWTIDGTSDNTTTNSLDYSPYSTTPAVIEVTVTDNLGCSTTENITLTAICCTTLDITWPSGPICQGSCEDIEINVTGTQTLMVPIEVNGIVITTVPAPPGLTYVPVCYGTTSPPIFVPLPSATNYNLDVPAFTHNGCTYDPNDVDFDAVDTPSAGPITIEACENNGLAVDFDLNDVLSQVTSGSVTIYENNQTTVINTTSYNPYNASNGTILYYKIEENGCESDFGMITLQTVPCCLDLSTTTPLNVTITEKTCVNCVETPGSITVTPNACPTGSTTEYSTDGTSWSTSIPIYDNDNPQTIYTRCYCDNNNISASSMATTAPVNCSSPTLASLPDLCIGETHQTSTTGTPLLPSPYSSSDVNVVTVDNNGLVTAVGAGSASIIFTDSNNCPVFTNVNVSTPPTLDPTALQVTDLEHVDLLGFQAYVNNGSISGWFININGTMTPFTPTNDFDVTNQEIWITLQNGSCIVTIPLIFGCPDLSQYTAVANIINSECGPGCTPQNGVINATICPNGTSPQYSTDNGTTWENTVPTYNQAGPAQTIITRCVCNLDITKVSPPSAPVTTVPGTCTPIASGISIMNSTQKHCIGIDIIHNATASGGEPPYTFTWFLDNTVDNTQSTSTFTFKPDMENTYTVRVEIKDSNGCSSMEESTVVVENCCPELSDTTLVSCLNANSTTATFDLNQISNYVQSIDPSFTTTIYESDMTTVIPISSYTSYMASDGKELYFDAKNATCTTAKAKITLKQKTPPTILQNTFDICDNQPIDLTSYHNAINNDPSAQFTWYQSTDATLDPSEKIPQPTMFSGDNIWVVVDVDGCTTQSMITYNISGKVVTFFNHTTCDPLYKYTIGGDTYNKDKPSGATLIQGQSGDCDTLVNVAITFEKLNFSYTQLHYCDDQNYAVKITSFSSGAPTLRLRGGLSEENITIDDLPFTYKLPQAQGTFEVSSGECTKNSPYSLKNIKPEITDIIIQNNEFCTQVNGSLTIIASGENLLYSIDGGATWSENNVFENLAAKKYFVEVKSSINDDCIVKQSVDVTGPLPPVIESGTYGSCDLKNTILSAYNNDILSNSTIKWYNGNPNNNGVEIDASSGIDISGMTLWAVAVMNDCVSLPVQMTIEEKGIQAEDFLRETCDASYSVKIGDTTFDINNPSGNATKMGTDGACDTIVTVALTFKELSTTHDAPTLCPDEDLYIQILGLNHGTPPFTITGGKDDASTQSFPYTYPVGSQQGSIRITDANNCSTTLDYDIVLHTPPKIEGPTVTQDSVTITVTEGTIDSLLWSPSGIFTCPTCPATGFSITENTDAGLLYYYGNNCTSSLTTSLFAKSDVVIEFPNVIRPDGDGRNDQIVFQLPKASNHLIEKVRIFDRWGNKVYQSKDSATDPPSWGGTHRAGSTESGVYVYIIQLKDGTGSSYFIKGTVTVIR